jgi:hypothetical protein
MKTIDFEAFAKQVAARKAELGLTGDNYVPCNSGRRRTPEKRAILAELKRMNSPFLVGVDLDPPADES